eukprot:1343902-Rhodomonas_salina.1
MPRRSSRSVPAVLDGDLKRRVSRHVPADNVRAQEAYRRRVQPPGYPHTPKSVPSSLSLSGYLGVIGAVPGGRKGVRRGRAGGRHFHVASLHAAKRCACGPRPPSTRGPVGGVLRSGAVASDVDLAPLRVLAARRWAVDARGRGR